MKTLHKDGSKLGHRFERSGYKAPYQYMGYSLETYQAHHSAPIQCGTSCNVCGTGIMHAFRIKDADGKFFVVGSDCVEHLGDKRLVVLVASEVRKQNAIKRKAREEAKKAELKPAYDAALVKLEKLPHPNAYFASHGKTYADYIRFCWGGLPTMKLAINVANRLTA